MDTAPSTSSNKLWTGDRLAVADLFRGLAAVGVVWHHLSLYAPQSDLADRFAPNLGFFCFNHALYSVAIFFVLSGLTASIDAGTIKSCKGLLRDILVRYLRLAVPYLVMIAVLLLVTWLTENVNWSLNLIDTFSWPMLAAHTLFLQDLLGYGNFSAGTWYLCIEMQWSCLMLILGFLAYRVQQAPEKTIALRSLILFPIGIASAWYFSHNQAWEPVLPYFASQYVLGLFLGWTMQGEMPRGVLVLYTSAIAASLVTYPRPQLLVSILFATTVWCSWRSTAQWRLPSVFRWLSQISYSLFLVHYFIHGVVLKAIDPWASQSPAHAASAMAIAFCCSLAVAHVFHQLVEAPTNRWLKRFRRRVASV